MKNKLFTFLTAATLAVSVALSPVALARGGGGGGGGGCMPSAVLDCCETHASQDEGDCASPHSIGGPYSLSDRETRSTPACQRSCSSLHMV